MLFLFLLDLLMRLFSVFFLFTYSLLFSQQKIIEKFSIVSNEIEVFTEGLDDIIIETSTTNEVEILLLNDNKLPLHVIRSEKSFVLQITFEIGNESEFTTEVFRKFITKRLERARVVVKIPKNKKIVIYGKTIGVTCKSYEGDLGIFIDKGNIQLGDVKGNTNITLFLGNVYGRVSNTELDIITSKGRVLVNKENKKSPYLKKLDRLTNKFIVKSIHANIYITEN